MTQIRIKGEPLVYREDGRHSFFADLVLSHPDIRRAPPGATERLERHGREMAVLTEERDARAWRELRSSGYEARVEPNLTQGTGGYFAPPLWLNSLFATANRAGRVLASLSNQFPLPAGVTSINVPLVSTGTVAQSATPDSAVAGQDVIDASASSNCVPFAGISDVSLQLLEQSPPNAAVDWAFATDLIESYDQQLEQQLLYGAGVGYTSLLGVANVASNVHVTYTSGSPTQSGLWPYLGQIFAQIGAGRLRPPECFLVRSDRWGWLLAGLGTDNLPFGLLAPNFLGQSADTPDPIGGLYGLPVFLDDAIPATCVFGTNINFATGTQDLVFCLRPSDLVLFESPPVVDVFTEVVSGALGARIRLHSYAAFLGARRPAGIGVVGGTGLVVQTGSGY